MKCNRVPRQRIFLGGILASLGLLFILNNSAVRAQHWTSSPVDNKAVVAPDLPAPAVNIGSPVVVDNPPANVPMSAARPMPSAVSMFKEILPYLEAEDSAEGSPKMNLQQCIDMAMQQQPALAAARASLGAAQQAYNGLYQLPPGTGLFARDLSIRLQQACLGIQIAQAGLAQAEWDTRYAVTRNYFSVVYARKQSALVQRIIDKLDRAHTRAVKLVAIGNPEFKVTQIDVDMLFIAHEKTRARQLEASAGVRKALAALHEAVGLGYQQPLDIVDDNLPPLAGEFEIKQLIAQALSQRGEMSQAQITAQITNLEIEAQGRTLFKPSARTFALGGDIHATQIPQGVANTEYRPGAIPPEMPVNLFGPRYVRMERARYFSARAGAVVDKTENLIALETKAAYWKWKEAAERLKIFHQDGVIEVEKKGKKEKVDTSLPARAERIAEFVFERFNDGKQASGKEYLEARGEADKMLIEYNEALYNHALGLTSLERVTAGGFRLNP